MLKIKSREKIFAKKKKKIVWNPNNCFYLINMQKNQMVSKKKNK